MTEKHLLAFLGTGRYELCRYVIGAEDWTSPPVRYVQTATALRYHESLSRLTIFATQKAREAHEAGLRQELAQQRQLSFSLEFVEVPEGFNEEDAYALFGVLKEHIDQGPKHLILDMTHGFRAQPMLMLMALHYLQSVDRELEVDDIVYGAFHFDAPKDEQGIAQVELVSLIQLWRLNRWANAFEIFNQTGSVRPLAALASQTQSDYMRVSENRRGPLPTLKSFALSLNRWQDALEHNAIPHLFGPQGHLPKLVNSLKDTWNPISAELGRFIEPLRVKMLAQLTPFAESAPLASQESLRAQLHFMRWLHRYGHYQSVYTIAREWLTTLIQFALAIESRRLADTMSTALTRVEGRAERLTPEQLAQLERFEAELNERLATSSLTIGGVISQTTQRRNKLNHAYYGELLEDKPEVLADLCKQGERVIESLEALFDAVLASASAQIQEADPSSEESTP